MLWPRLSNNGDILYYEAVSLFLDPHLHQFCIYQAEMLQVIYVFMRVINRFRHFQNSNLGGELTWRAQYFIKLCMNSTVLSWKTTVLRETTSWKCPQILLSKSGWDGELRDCNFQPFSMGEHLFPQASHRTRIIEVRQDSCLQQVRSSTGLHTRRNPNIPI